MTTRQPTAIVTGGSLGIGKGITQQLVERGYDVLIVGRRQSQLDETVAELNALDAPGSVWSLVADVALEADLDRLVAEAAARWDGRIDVLVNNAGIFDDATTLTLDKATWDAVMAVNLTAPFLLTQKVGRLMAAARTGAIVNMASIDGYGADATYVAYNVSKAAVLHLTKQSAVELGPLGIRVNSVSPGYTRTPMVETALSETALRVMDEGSWERVPLRRMVTIEEVANTVVFLCTDLSSGVTGTDVVVDGGTIANLWVLDTLPE